LAAFGGLMTGAAAGSAAAQAPKGVDATADGAMLYSQLHRAKLASDVVSVTTRGDSAVGVGAATFSTRLTRSPYARTFAAADGRMFEMLPDQEGWSITAYGARADGDPRANHEAIQLLIHHTLWRERNGFGKQQIVVDPGQYAISQALEIFVHDAKSGAFDNVSLSITAPARGYVAGRATQIRNLRLDQPTIVIAKARSVKISNLSLVGASAPYQPSIYELAGEPTWSNRAGMRASQWSPACGIVIDPFGSALPPDGGYPGLERYYTSRGGSSSNIIIENVEAQCFPAGIVVSPSTDTQIGDSVTIRDCNLSYNTYPVTTCQSQNRAVHVENCRIGTCHVAVSTNVFGNQNGSFPHCSGLNVTFAKYLLSGGGGIGSGAIQDCAVESTFALGAWRGGFALDVRSCHIKLLPPLGLYPPFANGSPTGHMPNIDWHLFAEGPVNFFGGYFGFYSNVPVPLSLVGGGLVNFHGTVVDCPAVSTTPGRVHYDNSPARYVSGGAAYGIRDAFFEQEGLLARVDALMTSGAMVHGAGGDGRIYRNLTGVDTTVLEGGAAIRVVGDGTAAFATKAPGAYRVGEWLCTTMRYAVMQTDGAMIEARGGLLGQVDSVTASRVTLRCVPRSLVSGAYSVTVQSLRPFRRRCIGTASKGSDTLTRVVPADHGFRVGDRLQPTAAIANGAYVKAVGPGTITLSLAAVGAGVTQVKTADMQLVSAPVTAPPAKSVTNVGDYFENSAPAVDANGRLLRGWPAITDGNPGVMAPQYVPTS
jgi:hypothetical protein